MRAGGPAVWRRAGAALLLLAIYSALSFLNSPRGFLGTDTGGKVATMRVMTERGSFDPDLGYWAERVDPQGTLYPLANTTHMPSGKWVNVTTLPALWIGWQLFRVGGYRAALLVPMAGSVAAAAAGWALLRRLGVGQRWAAAGFWMLGLASPLTIYALDFWEHSVGVALMAGALALLLPFCADNSVVPTELSAQNGALRVLAAGLLFGTAATMRTEALVYFAVSALVLAFGLLVRRRRGIVASGLLGLVLCAGLAIPLVANERLERAVVGSTIRGARVAGTAQSVGSSPRGRAEEAAITVVGLEGDGRGIVLGLALAALVAFAALRRDAGIGVAALAGAGALFLARAASGGLGFVPGLAAAWPLAVVGIVAVAVAARARRWGDDATLALVAVGAIPLVLATQYQGGAPPQWGGRYLLASGFVLAVLGIAALPARSRPVAAVAIALCVAVSGFGVAWLSVRSHDIDRTFAALNARPEEVVVSGVYYLGREGGATYGDKRWLTMTPAAGPDRVAEVLDRAGLTTFVEVEVGGVARRRFPGFTATDSEILRLFDGVDLQLTSWRKGS